MSFLTLPRFLRLHSRARFTFVDVILWVLRIAIILVVAGGTIATLIKGRYTASQWVDFVTFGVTLGSVYAQIALGYTMVYGVLRLINLAHGDVMMAGAFSGYFVASALENSGFLDRQPVLAMAAILAAAVLTSTIISILVERIAYRPFRRVSGVAPLICAIGVSFFLEQTFRGLFGSSARGYPDPAWQLSKFHILGASILRIDVIVVAVSICAMIGLYLIIQRTRMGKAMRAVSEDPDAAALMGIDATKVIVFTFILGGAMAGIAGVSYAMIYKQVNFFMGFTPGIKAFGAAVLGGIGSIPGAMFGGFFLGMIESIGPVLLLDGFDTPAPYQLRDAIVYAVMIMVLIFRPNGILGERMRVKRA